MPQNELDQTINNMKKEVAKEKGNAEYWKKRATKKSNLLIECLDSLVKAEINVKKHLVDEQDKELAASIAGLIKAVQENQANDQPIV